jgi:plastocyanin
MVLALHSASAIPAFATISDVASEGQPAQHAKGTAVVGVADNEFRPMQLTVTMGATVVWRHEGQNPHTVTADDRAFDSGTLESGTFSVTFDEAGTVPYYCQIHGEPGSGMFGIVVVQAAPAEEGDQDQASPAPDSNDLPRTGLEPIPLVIAALGLAMVGLLFLRCARNATGEMG